MKKLLLKSLILAVIIGSPTSMASISVGISIPLPVISWSAPPVMVPIPGTYIYAAPDMDTNLFFWNGWWWLLWEGRWYRSYYYDRGWTHYSYVPGFYFYLDPGWRTYYKVKEWHGHRWDYKRIPAKKLRRKWKSWEKTRHWEKRDSWGVKNYHRIPQKRRVSIQKQKTQPRYKKRTEMGTQRIIRKKALTEVQKRKRGY